MVIAQLLKKKWEGQQKVGILMPPTVVGALVNYSAALSGKVPVNLNYTLSEEALKSCIDQCSIKTVVTSKVFLQQIKLKVPCEMILIEELTKSVTILGKVRAILAAFVLPVGLLEKYLGNKQKVSMDDLATVIFSSGSTGSPKGVMLSHYNVASNTQQVGQAFYMG